MYDVQLTYAQIASAALGVAFVEGHAFTDDTKHFWITHRAAHEDPLREAAAFIRRLHRKAEELPWLVEHVRFGITPGRLEVTIHLP